MALQGPPFPELLESVWSAFLRLSATRGQGTVCPLPITYLEIKSYMDATQEALSPWDISIIKRLDQVYMRTLK